LCACNLLWGNPPNDRGFGKLVVGDEVRALLAGELSVAIDVGGVFPVHACDFPQSVHDIVGVRLLQGVHSRDGGDESSHADAPLSWALRLSISALSSLIALTMYQVRLSALTDMTPVDSVLMQSGNTSLSS